MACQGDGANVQMWRNAHEREIESVGKSRRGAGTPRALQTCMDQTDEVEHALLLTRYASHAAAGTLARGKRRAWHVAAARGLYRLLADRELAGGLPAPMGMPHALCLTDAEVQSL